VRPNGPPQPGRPSLGGGDFYDVAFKVMLVGDSGVGKTCLLVRFKDGAFLAGTFISTVGIDFRNKVLDVDGMKVKLQIWDTAGQERFRSVTHAYYRDAHGELVGAGRQPQEAEAVLRGCPGSEHGRPAGGCGRQEAVLTGPLPPALLLLYDVTNKASFDNIQAWLTEIQEYAQHDVVLMLLGNKVDSAQERAVKREDGEKLAKVSQGRVGGQGCPWGCRTWAIPTRLPPGCHQLFAGVRAALHGDQRQDRPQCRLGLHSHCKGVEAALHEGPQRTPLQAARLCQEGRPRSLLLHTLNLGGPCKAGWRLYRDSWI